MYSINSLMGSSSSSSSSSSKAIGGLATGLDTAELIKGMTSSTRLKIAKQKQSRQLLSWQTDAYRGVSDKLIEFSKKYTSFTSSANLLSSSFYTKTSISTSGVNADKVSISGSSTMTDNISIVSATKASEGGAISTKPASGANPSITGTAIDFSNPTISTVGGETISVNYNGTDYKINIDGQKFTDISDLTNALNTKLDELTIHGSSDKLSTVINFSNDGSKLSIATKSAGQSFEVSEFSDNLKAVFGFEKTQFTDGKLSVSSTTGTAGNNAVSDLTKDVDFADALLDSYVRISFNNSSRNISFTKEELESIRKKDASGNFEKVGDKYVYDDESKTKFAELFEKKLDTAFGKDAINVSITADNKLNFTTSNTGAVLKISDPSPNAQGLLGLQAGDSNRLKTDSTTLDQLGVNLFDFKIDGVDISPALDGSSTVQQLMDAVNNSGNGITMSYIEGIDRFEFKTSGDAHTITGDLANQLFGSTVDVAKTEKAELKVKYGNGAEITLSSNNNTFSIDGLSINVNDTFVAGSGDVKLSASTDTDKVLSTIKDMAKDYNDIVDLVNKEYSTKPKREYPPLTDEQRSEMSESEIKAWEEKAKTGMLFGNSDMSSLSSDLRFVFFSNKENMSALNEMGISSSSNWKDNGKIVINEEKLRKAIESDPENVKNIFTTPLSNKKDASGNDILVDGSPVPDPTSGGVMSRLKNLTDKYVKTEGSKKGILIEKAGNSSAPLSISKNTLLDRINSIDKVIKKLNTTLSTEQNRYQKQFSLLETAFLKLNSQSSYLQQFGG